MKKSLIYAGITCVAFAICVVTIVACNKNTENTNSNPATKTVNPAPTASKASLSNYPNNAISTSDANALIASYVNDQSLVATPAFAYTASTLLSFMNESENIVQLHAFLGQQTVNQVKELTLIVCGVDGNGNHIYITDGNPVVNYALDHCCPCPPNCPPSSLVNPTASTSYVSANYPQNLSLTTAQTMVATYQARTTKNTTASSFLINAPNLINFITNAPNIAKVQFFLGENANGVLSLIIVGCDSNGKQIYITQNQETYVFDHTLPCPICGNVANNGVNFE